MPIAYRSAATVLLVVAAAGMLSACASPRSITFRDSRSEAARTAESQQEVADLYRRGGAPEAAREVQRRADASLTKANKPHDGFFSWLFDTLFTTWLHGGK